MEYLYSRLKRLEIVSLTDGKNLGRICDLSLSLPEGKLNGFFATGGKGFKFTKSDTFIPLKNVVKIGEDAILVKLVKGENGEKKPAGKGAGAPPPPPPSNAFCDPRRSFDDYE